MSEMDVVLLCNPYGSDVTPYMRPTGGNVFLGPIMKGTMAPAGREIVTFSDTTGTGKVNCGYKTNESSYANVLRLANGIQAKLSTYTPGHVPGRKIVLFGYSQGCQGICLWYFLYGAACPIDPQDMEIVMIGHAGSRYGGFANEQEEFVDVAYIHDIPLNVKYETHIVARQYDGVGDFPHSDAIHNAYNFIAHPPAGAEPYNTAMAEMTAVTSDPIASKALNNAMFGMSSIHNFYQNVTLTDKNMRWWDEPGTKLHYGISPSWPAIGNPQDYVLQDDIEKSYDRPQDPIPYLIPKPATTWWGQPLPPTPPKYGTGWWRKIHKQLQFSMTMSMQAAGKLAPIKRNLQLSMTPTMAMAVRSRSKASFRSTLSLAMTTSVEGRSKGAIPFSMTPTMAMAWQRTHYKRTLGFSMTPTFSVTAREGYDRGLAYVMTPTMAMDANGTSKANLAFSMTPAMNVLSRGPVKAVLNTMTMTPSVAMAAREHYDNAIAFSMTPSMGVAKREHYDTLLPFTMTPSVAMTKKEHYDKVLAFSMTPSMLMSAVPYVFTPISLTDKFNDLSLWDKTISADANQVNSTNGELVMTHNAAGQYNGVRSINAYDFTSKGIEIEVTDYGSAVPVSHQMQLHLMLDDANYVMFVSSWTYGLSAYHNIAGAGETYLTSVALDAAAHRWLRLYEKGGIIYWLTSPDRVTWSLLWSEPKPFAVTSLKVKMWSGCWQAESIGSQIKVDNLNVVNIGRNLPFKIPAMTVAMAGKTRGKASFRPSMTPSVGMSAHAHFVPFSETNVNYSGASIPAGATQYRVTLFGVGGGPGLGFLNAGSDRGGGGGGGGASKIDSDWQNIPGGAATFNLSLGSGNGVASTFAIGSQSYSAGGGGNGGNGTATAAGAAGAAGVATTPAGLTMALKVNGGVGGVGGLPSAGAGGTAPDVTNGAAPGGGGGGGMNSIGSNSVGGFGGSSATVTASNTSTTTAGENGNNGAAGLAGAGGNGGDAFNNFGTATRLPGGNGGNQGAGAGGSSGGNGGTPAAKVGGTGYNKIEWR